ncbi:hypothetical protein FQR65_LT12138 [Abscondita terminalis]|nr:hypothetical protein FQR65_LT12138 [Abscondita terminalis]
MMYAIVWLTFLIGAVFASDGCNENLLVNISDGRFFSDGRIEHEGVVYTKSNQRYFDGFVHGCVCNIWSCVRKCCPDGFSVINGTCQKDASVFELRVFNYTVPINVTDMMRVIYNRKCDKQQKFVLSPKDNEEDVYYVQSNGQLYLPLFTTGKTIYDPEDYCLEFFSFGENETEYDLNAFVCFDDKYRCTHVMFVTTMYVVLLLMMVFKNAHLCELSTSVDLTGLFIEDDGSVKYGNLTFPPELQEVVGGYKRGCICELTNCIRKCCGVGQL